MQCEWNLVQPRVISCVHLWIIQDSDKTQPVRILKNSSNTTKIELIHPSIQLSSTSVPGIIYDVRKNKAVVRRAFPSRIMDKKTEPLKEYINSLSAHWKTCISYIMLSPNYYLIISHVDYYIFQTYILFNPAFTFSFYNSSINPFSL